MKKEDITLCKMEGYGNYLSLISVLEYCNADSGLDTTIILFTQFLSGHRNGERVIPVDGRISDFILAELSSEETFLKGHI